MTMKAAWFLPMLCIAFIAAATGTAVIAMGASGAADVAKAAEAAVAPADSAFAPVISLPGRDGKTISLESFRGKTVLVDFWASWCAPCKMSFPWLARMQEQYAPKGLVVIAVNLDKKREAAEDFLEKHPAPFVVAFDPSGKSAEAFQVKAMPSSFVIDPSGRILYTHVGFDPKKTGPIEDLIQEGCRP
jgi:cytochrome c biogenesis protein CcmG, thiol:disulfide interchange protein DsbE